MSITKYTEFLKKKFQLDMDTMLSAEEIQLLELLATFANDGMPLCVTGAMKLERISSPATIHRRLDVLVAMGYLEHSFAENNLRTKFLIPTIKAYKYFEKLNKLIGG